MVHKNERSAFCKKESPVEFNSLIRRREKIEIYLTCLLLCAKFTICVNCDFLINGASDIFVNYTEIP